MSKTIKTIIAGGIVLVVLVAAVIVLSVLPKNGEDTANSSESSVSAESETVQLVDEEYTDLLSIEVKNEADEYKIESAPDGKWTIASLNGFPLTTDFSTTASSLSSMYASSLVMEDCSDLSVYGLDKPSLTFKLNYKSGKSYSFEIGDIPNVTTAYTKLEGENDVYQLPQSKISELQKSALDFVSKTVIPSLGTAEDGSEAIPDINEMTISRPDLEQPMEFRRYTDKELANTVVSSINLQMIKPVVIDLNENGSKKYLACYNGLSANSVAMVNPTPEQLTELGFDTPSALLEYSYNVTTETAAEEATTTTEKFDVKLTVGAKAEGETEAYYVLRDGVNILYVIDRASLPFMDVKADDVISSIVAITPIVDLKSVDFAFGSEKHNLEFVRSEEAPDDANEYTALLDGAKVELDYAKKFLQIFYQPAASGINYDEVTVSPSLTFTYNLMEGKGNGKTVDIYVKPDRTTVIAVNGEKSLSGRAGYVEKLKKEYEHLKNGEEVTTDW